VSASETELRRGIAVLDQYRAQIETLAQQQEIIRISLEEHMRARETLVRYREAGKAAEVLRADRARIRSSSRSRRTSTRRSSRSAPTSWCTMTWTDKSNGSTAGSNRSPRRRTRSESALGDLQRRAEAHGAAVQDLYDRLQGPGTPGERS